MQTRTIDTPTNITTPEGERVVYRTIEKRVSICERANIGPGGATAIHNDLEKMIASIDLEIAVLRGRRETFVVLDRIALAAMNDTPSV
ncbi:MAG: hypothetical protein JWP89_2673 [Schlesneria sp.]|nr:hypothetical protein [Schlesneria sp.]